MSEELRRGGRERRVQERDLGPIAQLGHEALRVLPEVVDAVADAILDEEVDAAGLADARDGGREERNRLRVGERRELRVQGGDDGVRLERRRRAFVVGSELYEGEAASRTARLREDAEPRHRVDVVDAGLLLQDRVDLPHDGVCPLKRGGLGELDVDQEVALVFLRHE